MSADDILSDSSNESLSLWFVDAYQEIGNGVYSVIYALNSVQKTSIYLPIIGLVVATIQMVGILFTVNSSGPLIPWSSIHSAPVKYVCDLVSTPALRKFGLGTIASQLAIILPILLLGGFIAIAIAIRKQFKLAVILEVYALYSSLLCSILFIPIVRVLVNTIKTKATLDAVLGFGSLCCIVFVSLCIIGGVFELSPLSKSLSARSHSRLDVIWHFFKIVLIVLSLAFSNGLLLSTVSFITSLFISYLLTMYSPCIIPRMVHYQCASSWVFTWASLSAVVASIYNNDQSGGAVFMFLGGVPVVIATSFLVVEGRLEHLRTMPLSELQNPWEMEIRLRMSIQGHNRSSVVSKIKGNEKSDTRDRKRSSSEFVTVNLYDAKQITEDADSEEFSVCTEILSTSLSRFPDSCHLLMVAANFYIEVIRSNFMAYTYLDRIPATDPKIDQRVTTYRLQKSIESRILSAESNREVTQYNAQRALLEKAQQLDLRIVQSAIKFWSEVGKRKPDCDKLREMAIMISNDSKSAFSSYLKAIRISDESVSALRCYSGFLLTVIRDIRHGERLLERASEMQEAKTVVKQTLIFKDLLFDDRAAVISMSGNVRNLGEIVDCNIRAAQLFGYSKSTMIGKSLTMLLPEPFASFHNTLVVRNLRSGVSLVVNKRRNLVVVRRSGYLQDVIVFVKVYVRDLTTLTFIGVIEAIQHDSMIIIHDKAGTVTGISQTIAMELAIDKEKVDSRDLKIDQIIPDFDQHFLAFQKAAASNPDYVRMISLKKTDVTFQLTARFERYELIDDEFAVVSRITIFDKIYGVTKKEEANQSPSLELNAIPISFAGEFVQEANANGRLNEYQEREKSEGESLGSDTPIIADENEQFAEYQRDQLDEAEESQQDKSNESDENSQAVDSQQDESNESDENSQPVDNQQGHSNETEESQDHDSRHDSDWDSKSATDSHDDNDGFGNIRPVGAAAGEAGSLIRSSVNKSPTLKEPATKAVAKKNGGGRNRREWTQIDDHGSRHVEADHHSCDSKGSSLTGATGTNNDVVQRRKELVLMKWLQKSFLAVFMLLALMSLGQVVVSNRVVQSVQDAIFLCRATGQISMDLLRMSDLMKTMELIVDQRIDDPDHSLINAQRVVIGRAADDITVCRLTILLNRESWAPGLIDALASQITVKVLCPDRKSSCDFPVNVFALVGLFAQFGREVRDSKGQNLTQTEMDALQFVIHNSYDAIEHINLLSLSESNVAETRNSLLVSADLLDLVLQIASIFFLLLYSMRSTIIGVQLRNDHVLMTILRVPISAVNTIMAPLIDRLSILQKNAEDAADNANAKSMELEETKPAIAMNVQDKAGLKKRRIAKMEEQVMKNSKHKTQGLLRYLVNFAQLLVLYAIFFSYRRVNVTNQAETRAPLPKYFQYGYLGAAVLRRALFNSRELMLTSSDLLLTNNNISSVSTAELRSSIESDILKSDSLRRTITFGGEFDGIHIPGSLNAGPGHFGLEFSNLCNMKEIVTPPDCTTFANGLAKNGRQAVMVEQARLIRLFITDTDHRIAAIRANSTFVPGVATREAFIKRRLRSPILVQALRIDNEFLGRGVRRFAQLVADDEDALSQKRSSLSYALVILVFCINIYGYLGVVLGVLRNISLEFTQTQDLLKFIPAELSSLVARNRTSSDEVERSSRWLGIRCLARSPLISAAVFLGIAVALCSIFIDPHQVVDSIIANPSFTRSIAIDALISSLTPFGFGVISSSVSYFSSSLEAGNAVIIAQVVSLSCTVVLNAILGVSIEWDLVIFASSGSMIGSVIAVNVIDGVFTKSLMHLASGAIFLAFSVIVGFAQRSLGGRTVKKIQNVASHDRFDIILFGIFGGIFSTLNGFGAGLLIYFFVDSYFQLHDCVGCPTGILIAAIHSIFQLVYFRLNGMITGNLVSNNLYTIVFPVVLIITPIAAYINLRWCNEARRRQLLVLISICYIIMASIYSTDTTSWVYTYCVCCIFIVWMPVAMSIAVGGTIRTAAFESA